MLSEMCLLALVLFGANAQPQCTDAAMIRAEQDAIRIKSWDSAYRWTKLYGACHFVAADEGFSDSVGRLLVDHWSELPRAAALARQHPEFRAVIVYAASEMLDEKDLELIKKKAKTDCPRGLRSLCADIAHNANESIELNSHR